MSANIHYFLAANSTNGFYSLYDEITKSEDIKFLYILKGGPGCGKSSFMKTLANGLEKYGYDIEYIHCTADPNSLDGIFVPELGVAYLDGTFPHVLEPDYPGVNSTYLNMGDFYRTDELADKKDLVAALRKDYKAFYAKAYDFLSAAGKIGYGAADRLGSESVFETIKRRTNGICSREIPGSGKKGKIRRRFLGAFTYDGEITRIDTVNNLCKRICVIDNEFGFAPFMLQQIKEHAVAAGYTVIVSPSPLYPEKAEHLLIPELSLAFISASSAKPYEGEYFKHVRLDALVDKKLYHDLKCSLREEKKLFTALLEKARQNLFSAKSIHRELEAIYNPHVDFEGVYNLANKHIDLYK
jgi:hypothetical protein